MPFIRQTRDRRGYETTFVMHAYRSPQGNGRTRVLYLFRTPSHVRLGRRPLDDESREALEHTHPDLSFDWTTLGRDIIVTSAPDERPARPSPAPSAQAREAHRVPDDPSVLGRTLGAREAARLRSRYEEATLRVTRRSRTPEERDRLDARLRRLNPEDWADEVAIRAAAPGFEAAVSSILAELPQRRRGRRGGRRRPDGGPEPGQDALQDAAPEESTGSDASVIMAGSEPPHAYPEEGDTDVADLATGAGGDRDDRDRQPDDRGTTGDGVSGDS